MTRPGSVYDHIAGDYERHRPSYPQEVMDALRAHLEAGYPAGPGVLVDVGAGTGIATRLLRRSLAERFQVVGVEPGEAMRRQAVEATDPDLNITYVQATAENIPFANSSLTGVMVAQAVQWFERPRFYQEAVRALAPGGTLAILQNNRNWRESSFLDAYEVFLEQSSPSYSRHYRAFDIHSELLAVTGFVVEPPLFVGWDHPMSVDRFVGMARSSSQLQRAIQHLGEDETLAGVRNLAGEYADADDMLTVRYQTELYLARRTG